jgi:hypothetical protein
MISTHVSDIFTFRAPYEAVAEFRFVGMPISGPDVTPRRWSNEFELTTEARRDLDNPGTLGELASTFQVRFAGPRSAGHCDSPGDQASR